MNKYTCAQTLVYNSGVLVNLCAHLWIDLEDSFPSHHNLILFYTPLTLKEERVLTISALPFKGIFTFSSPGS